MIRVFSDQTNNSTPVNTTDPTVATQANPTVTPLTITYKLPEFVLPANSTITALTPTITGTLPNCSISPSLP
ncbi:MAG: hypothetical protein SFU98_06620 [Leptospiraceae bacterium]|nr:hypothetical protein [Leptospiraceae bacterium]